MISHGKTLSVMTSFLLNMLRQVGVLYVGNKPLAFLLKPIANSGHYVIRAIRCFYVCVIIFGFVMILFILCGCLSPILRTLKNGFCFNVSACYFQLSTNSDFIGFWSDSFYELFSNVKSLLSVIFGLKQPPGYDSSMIHFDSVRRRRACLNASVVTALWRVVWRSRSAGSTIRNDVYLRR